jgi:hypothetical protein
VYAYILMGCSMKRGLRVGGYWVADKLDCKPTGWKWQRGFFLEDFGEFSIFCLTVESSLYKYMRICLWSDI